MWLFFLLVILDVLYLLIFDEFINYFDIESCEVLVEVLINYFGVVIFVSYDMYFLLMIVDWFWFVNDGGVVFFDGDFEIYCDMFLVCEKMEILKEKFKMLK